MCKRLDETFCWLEFEIQNDENLTDLEQYQKLVAWAEQARRQNPNAFDAVTQWILDDAQWAQQNLSQNEQILMQEILGRFTKQNACLRERLKKLDPSVVNDAVYPALDRFDLELSGHTQDGCLRAAVDQLFSDFSSMRQPAVRRQIAGNKTGATGTDSVDLFGYINYLKDCDAAVQWALFMPETVRRQQQGFRLESLVYRKMPAMRLIGFEAQEAYRDISKRMEKMKTLDSLRAYRSELEFDVLFMHHYGRGVDVEPWHGVWGRFMKADTPVPPGWVSFDFSADPDDKAGPPYAAQFAYAMFSGDLKAMHARKGFDSDAMYDITRNMMLAQGVPIPYPDKYWTAEAFLNGCGKASTAYLFSAQL